MLSYCSFRQAQTALMDHYTRYEVEHSDARDCTKMSRRTRFAQWKLLDLTPNRDIKCFLTREFKPPAHENAMVYVSQIEH